MSQWMTDSTTPPRLTLCPNPMCSVCAFLPSTDLDAGQLVDRRVQAEADLRQVRPVGIAPALGVGDLRGAEMPGGRAVLRPHLRQPAVPEGQDQLFALGQQLAGQRAVDGDLALAVAGHHVDLARRQVVPRAVPDDAVAHAGRVVPAADLHRQPVLLPAAVLGDQIQPSAQDEHGGQQLGALGDRVVVRVGRSQDLQRHARRVGELRAAAPARIQEAHPVAKVLRPIRETTEHGIGLADRGLDRQRQALRRPRVGLQDARHEQRGGRNAQVAGGPRHDLDDLQRAGVGEDQQILIPAQPQAARQDVVGGSGEPGRIGHSTLRTCSQAMASSTGSPNPSYSLTKTVASASE